MADDKEWQCKNCGRGLESDLEPQKCPCGSQDIEAQQQLSMLESMMKNFLDRKKKNKAKS